MCSMVTVRIRGINCYSKESTEHPIKNTTILSLINNTNENLTKTKHNLVTKFRERYTSLVGACTNNA